MKTILNICILNLALSLSLIGGITPVIEKSPAVAFTENKGQVYDQHHRPRPDILYGAMAGDLTMHIRNNGVSYQLCRVDRLKEMFDPATGERTQHVDQQSVYRIDLTWVNCNTGFERLPEGTLPGYNNYFLESCPQGALYVKSHTGVTLKSLYNGIDLHYYENNGELKHDYIVAAHADYTKIQIRVAGATPTLADDGSLVLRTPLGTVQEDAPVVFQNGKQLKAAWVVQDDMLSFTVDGYDPNVELVIDPLTRIWGTYYGGTSVFNGTDYSQACATDVNDNIYLAGHTVATGSIIATVGAHQIALAGSDDAFLVKFDANGVRLWGTYFGGSGTETGTGCVADAVGNVYLTGLTGSQNVGTAIATSGVHQTSHAGGGIYDGYLAKFNASGVRIWSTYIGGTSNDFPQACAFDPNGGIYIAGITDYSTSGISTLGSHQPNHGGGNFEGYLVKFNPANGTRLWGTYYGGFTDDRVMSCATDPGGNVYISGYSASVGGNTIATSGSHQPSASGNSGAFLAKFNSSGNRLWGTFYGGAGDFGMDCATDGAGNVYLAGRTNTTSATTTLVATTGAHQTAMSGLEDAFVAKFNANGVRQWGTYYGGTDRETGFSCGVDASGNVFLGGTTASTNSSAIATSGSHQMAYGSGTVDCFVAKFDAAGNRIAGTYFGGAGYEYGGFLAVSKTGYVYAAGYTGSSSGTVIATAGGHQPAFGGTPYDAFLAKFDGCNAAPQPPAINAPTFACVGVPITFSTPLVGGVHSYTWDVPAGWTATGGGYSISALPGSTGIFSLSAENTCGITTHTLNMPVYQNPTVTVNSGTICPGNSFTLVPSGAVTYSYPGGPVVSPPVTSAFTVTGFSAEGCLHKVVSTVTVLLKPVITAPGGAICAGQSFTINPNGAATYTYSGGPVVTPASSSSYLVYGTGVTGCTNVAVVNVTVNPLPVFTPVSTHALLCAGEAATLSAANVSLNVGTDAWVVAPLETTTYTVTGTDAKGCTNTAVITQSVDACTGLSENGIAQAAARVYPNPANDLLYINAEASCEITVMNALGQTVISARAKPGRNLINVSHLASGVYFVSVGSAEREKVLKE
jgi:hypothetical protein